MSNQENFKLLHKEWMSWYDSEDNNCILKQIQYMLFDTLIYRVILKAREITHRDEDGNIKMNGAMHWLLDKCFFTNQLMLIRRLTDANSDARSLRKLLNSMHSKRKLLTRENYFTIHDKYEYDYSATKTKCDEYIKEQEQKARFGECYCIPEDLDWERSERMHRDFDVLSQVDLANRKPSDTISNPVFQILFQKLDSCQPLRDYIDHFVAHTLRPEKREKLDLNAVRITFDELWKAQKIVSSVALFINIYLLDRMEYGLLPIPHHSMLKYIELPLVQKEQKLILRKVEEDFRKEIHTWSINLNEFRTE